ncbi:pyrimidine 5'-nucleotidase [Alphaproteobacteria bacterium KMM 3653]|uniref:Pyrimidine 5'-nucleotidase n=1 Tax=Harenicola maris TaxID=2841044 RepID=A0AAP2CQW5_9RHOB|nr:pyrimidine 5'-nucleotidase [Harenicola maris]
MTQGRFEHITTWVFDLDNTLYPPHMRLFDQIEVKMVDWIVQELGVTPEKAGVMRAEYWRDYGTTLSGLMQNHGLDPAPYLTHVHDIDFSVLSPEPALAEAIAALPGRKIVYTNGCEPYAHNVLKARGLGGLMDAVYGIEHADFLPKPQRAAYDMIFALDGVPHGTAAMFEDDPRNLAAPHDMGLTTVHVAPAAAPAAHIHHHTDDLAAFLTALP